MDWVGIGGLHIHFHSIAGVSVTAVLRCIVSYNLSSSSFLSFPFTCNSSRIQRNNLTKLQIEHLVQVITPPTHNTSLGWKALAIFIIKIAN